MLHLRVLVTTLTFKLITMTKVTQFMFFIDKDKKEFLRVQLNIIWYTAFKKILGIYISVYNRWSGTMKLEVLRANVSIHRTNSKYRGKWWKIDFAQTFIYDSLMYTDHRYVVGLWKFFLVFKIFRREWRSVEMLIFTL